MRFLSLIVLSGCVSAWAGADEVRREPLVLREGGTPEEPAVFDGKGMVIDLGIDVTEDAWLKTGDVWTSKGSLRGREPVADAQRAGLFIDEVPLRIVRERGATKDGSVRYLAPDQLQPGQMGWAEDGSLYFRWPLGKSPESARVILPPDKLQSCVIIACSHITVRNVTAMHAANDGFNIHGDRVGIRLENVKAFSNGDEGISAHETVQMDVFDSEIAWNGSSAGGVADVTESVTTYTRCLLHHNLGAAFFFDGLKHRVTDCVIHDQARDIVIRDLKKTKVTAERVEWRPEQGSATGAAVP